MKSLTILLLLASCSNIKVIDRNDQKPSEMSVANLKKSVVTPAVLTSIPLIETYNGKVRFHTFASDKPEGAYEITCEQRKLPIYIHKAEASVYISESYFSGVGTYDCLFDNKIVFRVKRGDYPYKSEQLRVDKKRVFLNKKDQARVQEEAKIKEAIYKNSAKSFYFNKPFKAPLNSYITSYYGNKRIFNDKKQSQHLGNDFRARTPTPIPASNRGRVVYTGNLFFSGNIVIIDHGLGIFSAYGHLSKINVQAGDIVNQGDVLGLSGATGRVSGPHLHWGIRIQSQWIDGFSLVEQSSKHFMPTI